MLGNLTNRPISTMLCFLHSCRIIYPPPPREEGSVRRGDLPETPRYFNLSRNAGLGSVTQTTEPSKVLEEARESEDREGWKRLRFESPSLSPEAFESAGSALVEDFYRGKALSGQRNIAWLKRSQAIRAALEKFWAAMRDVIRLGFDGSAFTPRKIDSLKSSRRIGVRSIFAEIVLANAESIDNPPPTQLLHEAKAGWKRKLKIVSPRPKTKRRAEKPPNEPHVHAERLDPDPKSHEVIGAIIPVTRRAFDVFALMFPCKEETSRNIEWDSLVHAMTDVGFTARNNGGSAVVFERNSQCEEKIVFYNRL